MDGEPQPTYEKAWLAFIICQSTLLWFLLNRIEAPDLQDPNTAVGEKEHLLERVRKETGLKHLLTMNVLKECDSLVPVDNAETRNSVADKVLRPSIPEEEDFRVDGSNNAGNANEPPGPNDENAPDSDDEDEIDDAS